MLRVYNTWCSWDHVHSSSCLDSRWHLRRPGKARKVRASVLHQAFWRNGLVPGQCSQGRRAPGVHAEEWAVSLLSSRQGFHLHFKSVWLVTTLPIRRIMQPTSCASLFASRLQDAVSLVSLFHTIHPHSESVQEATRLQASGTDLLKVRKRTTLSRGTADA